MSRKNNRKNMKARSKDLILLEQKHDAEMKKKSEKRAKRREAQKASETLAATENTTMAEEEEEDTAPRSLKRRADDMVVVLFSFYSSLPPELFSIIQKVFKYLSLIRCLQLYLSQILSPLLGAWRGRSWGWCWICLPSQKPSFSEREDEVTSEEPKKESQ